MTLGELRAVLAASTMPASSPVLIYTAGADRPLTRAEILPAPKHAIIVLSTGAKRRPT